MVAVQLLQVTTRQVVVIAAVGAQVQATDHLHHEEVLRHTADRHPRVRIMGRADLEEADVAEEVVAVGVDMAAAAVAEEVALAAEAVEEAEVRMLEREIR